MGWLGGPHGWFQTIARTCQRASGAVLNGISCGGRWGDRFYQQMEEVGVRHVKDIYERKVDESLAQGATEHQAHAAAAGAMERLYDPKSVSDLGSLVKTAAQTSTCTVRELAAKAVQPDPNQWKNAAALIGAALLGALAVYWIEDEAPPAEKSGPSRRRSLW